MTWIYHFPYKVSHWTEEGKISFLHVGLANKLESTHKDKAINQNKGKSQSITLKFAIA